MRYEYAQMRIIDHLREFADKPEWRSQPMILRETGVGRGQFETVIKCLLALPKPAIRKEYSGKYIIYTLLVY